MSLKNSKAIAPKMKRFVLVAVPVANDTALPWTMIFSVHAAFMGVSPSVSQPLHEEGSILAPIKRL